jgi:hypothetical protein
MTVFGHAVFFADSVQTGRPEALALDSVWRELFEDAAS